MDSLSSFGSLAKIRLQDYNVALSPMIAEVKNVIQITPLHQFNEMLLIQDVEDRKVNTQYDTSNPQIHYYIVHKQKYQNCFLFLHEGVEHLGRRTPSQKRAVLEFEKSEEIKCCSLLSLVVLVARRSCRLLISSDFIATFDIFTLHKRRARSILSSTVLSSS